MRLTQGMLIGTMVLGLAAGARATEGGGGAYPNGAEGLMTGALPPSGQYLVDYLTYYSADSFRGDTGNSVVPKFDLHALADVVRLINVTSNSVLGGTWAQQVFIPVVYLDATIGPPATPMRDHKVGLGDVIVDPFIVGWHKPPFHWIVGMDTYIPTGMYDGSALANIGRHYWTFEPVAAATYLDDHGIELSAKVMYDFNTENQSTDIHSGQEFHTDFVAAKHCDQWACGIGGYWYQQTTDDKATGLKLNASRGRVLALGPQVSYQYQKLSFVLAYDREFAVENRPEGDKCWLKLVMPL